jgi:hypothetical protein
VTTLSLDHLTIFDASPAELVTIAADLSLPLVSLWTQLPLKADLPLVTPAIQFITDSEEPNVGVTIDLLHLIRTAAADIRAMDPALIGYVRLR